MQYQFAIVGCGQIAARHAVQAAAYGRLVAVCDVVPDKADTLAAATGARPYYNIQDMLAAEPGLDLVSICTPNGLHAPHSIAALRAGCHVLCEKPMCLTTVEGKAMIAAADHAGKKLFVVKSSRHNPLVEQLKQLLADNQLGQVHSFQLNCVWQRPAAYYTGSWRGSSDMDGGTLYTQFSHYIDVLLWLLGDAKAVTGFRSNSGHEGIIDFEDTGALAIQLESGSIGTIHYSVNAVEKNQEVSLTLVGANATIKLGGEYMNLLLYQQPVMIDVLKVKPASQANDYGFYKGSMSNHDKVYANVVQALDGYESLVTDGESALKTVRFIENVYQQIKYTPY